MSGSTAAIAMPRSRPRAFAGLPSTTICLTCHSQLFATADVLEPLRRSAATGLPIAWKRVHTLPDFVYFNHGIHVAKGVACSECHGRVDQMPLTWRAASLRDGVVPRLPSRPGAAPAPEERGVLDGTAAPARAPRQRASSQAARLQSTRRLTDCSTCHR